MDPLESLLFFRQQPIDFLHKFHEFFGILLNSGVLAKLHPMLFVFHGVVISYAMQESGCW